MRSMRELNRYGQIQGFGTDNVGLSSRYHSKENLLAPALNGLERSRNR